MTGMHALYVGAVLGLAMKHGLPFRPCVDEDGNYTNELTLEVEGVTITLVVPPPPEGWNINDWIGGT